MNLIKKVSKIGYFKKNVNRWYCIAAGVLFLVLIFTENYIFMQQPVCNLGMYMTTTADGFYVEKVNPDSPAGRAGIRKHEYYPKLNNLKADYLSEYSSTHSISEYMIVTSNYFRFGAKIYLTDKQGNRHDFVIEKTNLLNQIRNLPEYVNAKLIVAVFSILCGLFCSIFYAENKKTRPMVFFLYFLGITIYNAYTTAWEPPFTTNYSLFLFDLGGLSAVSCLSLYISRYYSAFKTSKVVNFFSMMACYLPITIFIIKYILVFCLKWNMMDNPLLFIAQVVIGIDCMACTILFIYMQIRFSRQITLLFRFFLIGSVMSLLPSGIFLLKSAFSYDFYVTSLQKLITIIPLSILPAMIVMCVIQSFGPRYSYTVRMLITWIGYLICMSIFLVFSAKIVAVCLLAVAPYLYFLVKKPVNRFLSFNSKQIVKENEAFMEKLNHAESKIDLYRITAEEIKNRLLCSFVFFHNMDKNGIWNISYAVPITLSGETMRNLITEKQKMNVNRYATILSDGTLVITNPESSEALYSSIYIGKKLNGDIYVPGEHDLIEAVVDLFYKREILDYSKDVTKQLQLKKEKIIQLQNDTIIELANLIENRDGSTGQHAKRTSMYSQLLAQAAFEEGVYKNEIDRHFVELITKAAPMHDVGKITVSDSILKKPSKLSDEEFTQMKKHTLEGEHVIDTILGASEDINFLKMVKEIATCHHERWNGTGYPCKLKENQIPLSARIMAIADVFDALVSPRCYKESWPLEIAFEYIESEAGSHFDPVLAKLFISHKEQVMNIMKDYED